MEKGRRNISFTSTSLLIEIVFVTVTIVFLLRFLQNGTNNNQTCLTVPFVLLSASIVPTIARKRDVGELGFNMDQPGLSLRVLSMICIVVFPALFCGILLLRYFEFPLPLSPVVPEKGWLSWLIFQFMCVAVAEEAFFRGYLQSNIQHLLTLAIQKNASLLAPISVIISATIFAGFHSIIFGNVMSIITFFPGLILGWLFFKTKSLLAPILFHGLANAGYGFLASMLT